MMNIKLQTDEDGNPICLICDEKLATEHDWIEHIELEKSKLIKNIANLKDYKISTDNLLQSPISEQCRRKREYELLRIRSNQQKRLELKNRGYHRDDTSNSQLNRPTNSSNTCPQMIIDGNVKKDECNEQLPGNSNFCRFCERHHEYLIISNNFDHPRCHDCFLKLRAQTGVLPLSITSPVVDCCSPSGLSDGTSGKVSSPHSPLSLVVEQKRSRID
ncbi:Protein Teyrha-meyrha [Dirofilaria immitis]